MSDFETFRWVCAALSPGFGGGAASDVAAPPSWNDAIHLAGHQLVTPALAWTLAGHPMLPPEVADYLDAVLGLSRLRAGDTSAALAAALPCLNAAGVVPIALKGGAGLVEGLYPDPGMRVLHDLDLLVPSDRLDVAAAALAGEGWAPQPASDRFHAEHHHLPVQIHPAWPVGVELHRYPLVAWLRGLLDAPETIAASRPRPFGGAMVRLPSATHQVVHVIAHGQIVDEGHRRGVPQIRQLLDLTMLRARHDAEIDWDEVAARFRRARSRRVLADTLALTELLFGQAAPQGLGSDPHRAEARLRRAMASGLRRRAVGVRAVAARYAGAIRFDPKLAFHLFDRRRLARLIAAIRLRS